jgi:hypothetical protein
MADFEQALA